MFCPDNFYEILRCRYSWPRTGNVLYHFYPHGSKDLRDLIPFISNQDSVNFDRLDIAEQYTLGKIILHDQEPFSLDIAHTYKLHMMDHGKYHEFEPIIPMFNRTDLLNGFLKGAMQNILCHSELNSDDVREAVEDGLMIECYYWYHAMVARDWFRHWQYHPDCEPRDKSRAPYRFIMYARGTTDSRAYRPRFIEGVKKFRGSILFDWDREREITPDHSAKITPEDAVMSSIHIVLETVFETKKIHLTEKIFKPIVMSQPFFLLAGPGSLKYLRDYGFQTFGDFWDESYDDIDDHDLRMQMIIQETDKLASMSHDQFQDLYQRLLPVVEHNRRHFYSQEFQDHCIKEMQDNFARALEIQQNNLTVYPGGAWMKVISKALDHGSPMPTDWGRHLRIQLKSQHLPVEPEQIFRLYPRLRQYFD